VKNLYFQAKDPSLMLRMTDRMRSFAGAQDVEGAVSDVTFIIKSITLRRFAWRRNY
jgi:hypothetical protein